jgi:hypothetical protein
MKPIKVYAGKNVMTLPIAGPECAYCKAEVQGDGPDSIGSFLWTVCSDECDLAMSYLLDGCSEDEVRNDWEGFRADPKKLEAAMKRIADCVFIEPVSSTYLLGHSNED